MRAFLILLLTNVSAFAADLPYVIPAPPEAYAQPNSNTVVTTTTTVTTTIQISPQITYVPVERSPYYHSYRTYPDPYYRGYPNAPMQYPYRGPVPNDGY